MLPLLIIHGIGAVKQQSLMFMVVKYSLLLLRYAVLGTGDIISVSLTYCTSHFRNVPTREERQKDSSLSKYIANHYVSLTLSINLTNYSFALLLLTAAIGYT